MGEAERREGIKATMMGNLFDTDAVRLCAAFNASGERRTKHSSYECMHGSVKSKDEKQTLNSCKGEFCLKLKYILSRFFFVLWQVSIIYNVLTVADLGKLFKFRERPGNQLH